MAKLVVPEESAAARMHVEGVAVVPRPAQTSRVDFDAQNELPQAAQNFAAFQGELFPGARQMASVVQFFRLVLLQSRCQGSHVAAAFLQGRADFSGAAVVWEGESRNGNKNFVFLRLVKNNEVLVVLEVGVKTLLRRIIGRAEVIGIQRNGGDMARRKKVV
jgi:hypothetical protein